MKKNRVLLLIVLLVITGATIGYMNMHYDKLARNTHVTKENHDLLLKRLNEEQIIYVVEHNEDVTKYDEFLSVDSFEFENRMYYAEVNEVRQGNTYTIVNFVNNVNDKMEHDDVLEALKYYDYTLLKELILNHSYYNSNASVVLNPDRYDLDLNLSNTIGKYKPTDLIHLNYYDNLILESDDLVLRKEAADALDKMCKYLGNVLNEPCGGFKISEGYLSYDEIQQAYSNTLNNEGPIVAYERYGYPSHNEHQLGLAVDLIGDSFNYQFLRKICEGYGFVYYKEEASYAHLSNEQHLRYVGIDNIDCFKEKACEGDK